jgi:hypothetical protein
MNTRFTLFCIGIFLGIGLMSIQSVGHNSHDTQIEEVDLLDEKINS